MQPEKKELALYGAGGFGREVAVMIKEINAKEPTWNFVGFFDDGKAIGDEVSHFGKVLGGIDELNAWPRPIAVALCMGSPRTVMSVRNKILNPNVSFPNLIHPHFYVGDPETFHIGEGNIIKGACTLTTDVTIGNFNMLNGFINLGHDVTIGDFNAFMPGGRISGEVKIGNCNLFGADCFVKQQLHIGNGVTVSPLSALLTKPKDGKTYIGNPAKLFKY